MLPAPSPFAHPVGAPRDSFSAEPPLNQTQLQFCAPESGEVRHRVSSTDSLEAEFSSFCLKNRDFYFSPQQLQPSRKRSRLELESRRDSGDLDLASSFRLKNAEFYFGANAQLSDCDSAADEEEDLI